MCRFRHHLFYILALQPILLHTIVTEGHYILFSIEKFVLRKNRAELFDCGVSNDLSKVTHPLVYMCIVFSQCFCFASSVYFGLFKNLILSGFVRNWCCFPSRKVLYTSICLSIFFFLRSMFAVFAFILLFVHCWLCSLSDMFQIYRCLRKKSVDYFVCSICRYGIDQALFHQLKVFG